MFENIVQSSWKSVLAVATAVFNGTKMRNCRWRSRCWGGGRRWGGGWRRWGRGGSSGVGGGGAGAGAGAGTGSGGASFRHRILTAQALLKIFVGLAGADLIVPGRCRTALVTGEHQCVDLLTQWTDRDRSIGCHIRQLLGICRTLKINLNLNVLILQNKTYQIIVFKKSNHYSLTSVE